jgi:hypothetical protein
MSFYLLSKTQKRDTNPNRNFVNYKENELYKYVENKSKKKQIYDSNFILKKKKVKKDKILNFERFTKFNYKKKNKKLQLQLFNNKANLLVDKLNKKKVHILNNEYPVFNDTMYNKKKYIKKFFYSKNGNNNNINKLNGLFSKFYILSNKKNKNMNYIINKKKLLHDLNKNVIFNININNSKLNENINNLYLFSTQNTDNSNIHRFKCQSYYSLISHSKNINKNVINSKIL